MTLPAFFVKANEVEKGSIMKVLYGLDRVLVVSTEGDPEIIMKCLNTIMDKLEDRIKNPGAGKEGKDD